MMNNTAYSTFIVNSMLNRIIEDGQRLNPEEPGAYSITVLAACFSHAMKILIEKCSEEEINNLKRIFEDTIAMSELMESLDINLEQE